MGVGLAVRASLELAGKADWSGAENALSLWEGQEIDAARALVALQSFLEDSAPGGLLPAAADEEEISEAEFWVCPHCLILLFAEYTWCACVDLHQLCFCG